MRKRFRVNDDLRNVIVDNETNKKYVIDGAEDLSEICGLLNELKEDIDKEKDKYSQLFEKYWDYKVKLNKISNVIYRYDNKQRENLAGDDL